MTQNSVTGDYTDARKKGFGMLFQFASFWERISDMVFHLKNTPAFIIVTDYLGIWFMFLVQAAYINPCQNYLKLFCYELRMEGITTCSYSERRGSLTEHDVYDSKQNLYLHTQNVRHILLSWTYCVLSFIMYLCTTLTDIHLIQLHLQNKVTYISA
jgi:hypothetical protein